MFDYFENELSLIKIDKNMNNYDQIKIHFGYLSKNYQRHKKEVLRKIKNVSIMYKLILIYNRIGKKLGINEYNSFYLNELSFYVKQLELIDTFIEYQKNLLSILDEDNLVDIYKLSILTNMQFCSNDKYLNAEIDFKWIEFNRESKNIYRSLIYDRENEFSDTRDSFDDFFKYKYNQLTSSNTYKKML